MAVIKTPLQIDAAGKIAILTRNEHIITQKIKDYLLTNVLERIMRPAYGANTSILVHENFDSMVFEEYKMEAIAGLRRNVSGAEILGMAMRRPNQSAVGPEDENSVIIEVQYKIPPFGVKTAAITVVNPDTLTGDILV